jgi:hypothetical protein
VRSQEIRGQEGAAVLLRPMDYGLGQLAVLVHSVDLVSRGRVLLLWRASP